MKRLLILSSCLIFTSLSTLHADIWVPPWGEAIYDSITIDIQVDEDVTIVNVTTVTAVLKLISDDYLLTFTREPDIGECDVDDVELGISDSLVSFNLEDDRLELLYLSTVALEDTLVLSVHSSYAYYPEDEEDALHELIFNQAIKRTSEDTVWQDWVGMEPVYYGAPFVTRIRSNVNLSASIWSTRDERWEESRSGDDITFEGNIPSMWEDLDSIFYFLGHRIQLDNESQVSDTLTEELIYELTPEVRMLVPDIIIDEDVRINLVNHQGHDTYRYHMLADIKLNPGLARALSPMWLWFPNDETQAHVDLYGLIAAGAWGYFPEDYHEYSLEIRQQNGEGQNGFYIFLPTMESIPGNPHNVWFWTDPNLMVEITQTHEGDSARFILITAPLDPSRIRFTIPDWEVFINWSSPFEDVERYSNYAGNNLTFSGICREPGIARVEWVDYREAPPDPSTLYEFELSEAHPNPFNAVTKLSYTIPSATEIKLTVHDATGREVDMVIDDYVQAGCYEVAIDASNWAAGVYMARLKTESEVRSVKLVCLK